MNHGTGSFTDGYLRYPVPCRGLGISEAFNRLVLGHGSGW
jgi:hypothetical protein